MHNVKNIIFDFGGVIVNLDRDRCVSAFQSINAAEISRYVDNCIQKDLFHDFEIGKISVEEFCDKVREKSSSCKCSDAEIIAAWASLLVDVPTERLRIIQALKKKYRVFLLSNTNEIHWKMAEEQYFTQVEGIKVDDYFEKKYLSCRLHMVKPSKEIFEMLMSENNLLPSETLFFDDSETNRSVAQSLGILTTCDEETGGGWVLMRRMSE